MRVNDMAQWVRALAVTPHKLSSILEPTWWKEKLITKLSFDLHTHALWYTHDSPHTFVHTHTYTHSKQINITKKFKNECCSNTKLQKYLLYLL